MQGRGGGNPALWVPLLPCAPGKPGMPEWRWTLKSLKCSTLAKFGESKVIALEGWSKTWNFLRIASTITWLIKLIRCFSGKSHPLLGFERVLSWYHRDDSPPYPSQLVLWQEGTVFSRVWARIQGRSWEDPLKEKGDRIVSLLLDTSRQEILGNTNNLLRNSERLSED